MCEVCLRTTVHPLSRRQFLGGAAAAALALGLSACAPAVSPGQVGGRPAFDREAAGFPDLAGRIAHISGQELILAGIVGERQLLLEPGTIFLNLEGQRTKASHFKTGQTILVWLLPASPDRVLAARHLPPISATADPIPAIDGQSIGNGNRRPLGSLSVITRPGWGAAPRRWVPEGESGLYDPLTNPNGWMIYPDPLAAQLHTVIVHHSALEFMDGPQMVQAMHMTTARFADIGYHFLIDGLGQLYEGRPPHVRGAHTGGFNTGYVGICLLGNFEIAPPLQAQVDTLTLVAAHLKETYAINRLGGHRDFQPGFTACPGRNLHPLLRPLTEALSLTLVEP